MTNKMTCGKPIKLIFLFMIPLLIGNIVQQIYFMTDSIIVGRFIGVNALAGVGIAGSLLFMSFGFMSGLCSGFSVVLAQRFGAGSRIGVKRCVTTSIYLGLFFTIIITLINVMLVKTVLLLINTPEEVMEYAVTYILTLSYGTFAMTFYNLFSGMLRAVGNSKTPLYFLIFSAILNFCLDYLAVAVFKLSVMGSAAATIVSQIISSVLCAMHIFRRYKLIRPRKIDWKINWPYVRLHMKIGFPMALEFSVTAIGILILQGAINKLGANVVAGFTAAMKIENLIITAFIALASAVSTYTAQNFGARNYKRIVSGAKSNVVISFAVCLILGSILFVFWDVLVSLFVADGEIEVKQAAHKYITIAVVHYPVLCLLITFRCFVQSLGRTIVPVLAGFSEVFMRSVGAFFLSEIFGYVGACYSSILSWYSAFIMIMASYIFAMIKLKKEFAEN